MKQNGILTFTEINELIDQGVIENVDRKSVNAASLNVTLGPKFMVEKRCRDTVTGTYHRALSFAERESPEFFTMIGHAYLGPGEFCLASIVEKVNLPADIACHVLLRSSAARMGIEHSLAGWGDPLFSGHLTLEFSNVLKYHAVKLQDGDQVCQLIFHRVPPVPTEKGYRGKYSNFDGPQAVLPEYGR